MSKYEVKYMNMEFPPYVELSLPFMELPETESKEELDKLRADAAMISEYFFPGLSEVLLALEFVLRQRYVRAGHETLEHVQSVFEHELHARETFPQAAYFRGVPSMSALYELSPRVAERVRHLAKKELEPAEASMDPVLEQLRYGIEFHSMMVDIQLALSAIRNQRLEKEIVAREGMSYDFYPDEEFTPAAEFANFDIVQADTEFSNEDLLAMFATATMSSSKKYDAAFFQRLADMLRSAQQTKVEVESDEAAQQEVKSKPAEKKKSNSSTKKPQEKGKPRRSGQK